MQEHGIHSPSPLRCPFRYSTCQRRLLCILKLSSFPLSPQQTRAPEPVRTRLATATTIALFLIRPSLSSRSVAPPFFRHLFRRGSQAGAETVAPILCEVTGACFHRLKSTNRTPVPVGRLQSPSHMTKSHAHGRGHTRYAAPPDLSGHHHMAGDARSCLDLQGVFLI